jgi:hypothetical protein
MARIELERREFLRAAGIFGATVATTGWPEMVGAVAAQQPAAAHRQFSLAYLTVFGCPPPEMTYIAGRAG